MLSTASVRRVVEQQLGDEKSILVTESDLNHAFLLGVQGHRVNGVPFCPSVSAFHVSTQIAKSFSLSTPTWP